MTTVVPKVNRPLEWTWKFPNDFILVIDTREQQPLFKRPPKGLVIVRDKLDIGDYSIRGFEQQIAVERKRIEELYRCATVEREDFKDKLEVMSSLERKWLFIEGTVDDLFSWQIHTDVHPNIIRGFLASVQIKLNIPVVVGSRTDLQHLMLDLFVKYFNWKRKEK